MTTPIDAAGIGAALVKPLNTSGTQGYTDEKGKFCLPLTNGYFIKFPPDSDGLFMVWYFHEPVGADRMMSDAKTRAQEHHRARIAASLDLGKVLALVEAGAELRKRCGPLATDGKQWDAAIATFKGEPT